MRWVGKQRQQNKERGQGFPQLGGQKRASPEWHQTLQFTLRVHWRDQVCVFKDDSAALRFRGEQWGTEEEQWDIEEEQWDTEEGSGAQGRGSGLMG